MSPLPTLMIFEQWDTIRRRERRTRSHYAAADPYEILELLDDVRELLEAVDTLELVRAQAQTALRDLGDTARTEALLALGGHVMRRHGLLPFSHRLEFEGHQ